VGAVIVQKGLSPNVRYSAVMSVLRNTAEYGWWPATEAFLFALDRDTRRRVCIDLLDFEDVLVSEKYRQGLEEVLRDLGG
jgi:hypothetical protein